MAEQSAKKQMCFVIGPIGNVGSEPRRHADWLLETIIVPVFEKHFPGFDVQRPDRISSPGSISSQTINLLHTAELVIADMSFQNANAFYEMGIRHMKRKPIIHMFLDGDDIPFDVKPYRAIPFKYNHPSDLIEAQKLLKSAIEEAVKSDFVVDNPVTQARGMEKLEETATPAQRAILNEVREVRSATDRLTLRHIAKDPPGGLSNLVPARARKPFPPARAGVSFMSVKGASTLGLLIIGESVLTRAVRMIGERFIPQLEVTQQTSGIRVDLPSVYSVESLQEFLDELSGIEEIVEVALL